MQSTFRRSVLLRVLFCLLIPGICAVFISLNSGERHDSNIAHASQPEREAGTQSRYQSVLIRRIPHIKQKPDFCGEACAAMYLQMLGYNVDQDFVFDSSGLNPLLGRGCYTKELRNALENIGFQTGATWFRVRASHQKEIDRQFSVLLTDLAKGIPSIVCMHYDNRPKTTEHFRLILGYDSQQDEVIYHEPAIKNGAYQRMSRQQFLKLWPLKYHQKYWTVIRLPMKPGKLVIRNARTQKTDADYAQHIMQLKKRLPHRNFHIVIQKPFVVIGDESSQRVKARSIRTVKWAVDQLKSLYFKNDPHEILDIWLFKDRKSYESNAFKLFKSRPTTPFGYYSSRDGALVMNISTGGGTLVHEIVHPFIASNFPGCPSWFNEGLASLYEQCGEENGRITGYTNWRLAGLKQAIRAGKVPSFKTLCSTTTREFYREDPGTNYSQARYLCYYLQQKGLLVKYFNAFRKNVRTDPTGYRTLQTILGTNNIPRFKKQWEQYVLALR
ncbi:MAG: hypothetical protein Tsb009_36860 [Planctomycetaceae bacterium]